MHNFAASLILFFYWILSCFILPFKANRIAQQSQIKATAIPRSKNYKSSIIGLSCIAILAIVTAYLNQLPVFGQIHMDHKILLLAFGFLVLNMSLIEPLEWKYISEEIKQRYGNHSPHTDRERLVWIAVSLIGAVSEEILYRAVFFGIFYQLTGNYWMAGLISAALFTIAHWKYGLTALPIAFFVALGLQYFVKISGGLFVAIAIHFIHNLVNGIVYGWLWKRKLETQMAEGAISDGAEMGAIAQKAD